MTPTQSPVSSTTHLAAQAEEVRAYVVAARGGAPFLSAADGRLLVRWLEAGISVARILAAVDEVAERRRQKRTRGRLSLSACKRSIEGKKQSKTTYDRPDAPSKASLAPYALALEAMDVAAEFEPERTALVRRIQALDHLSDPDALATEAVAAVRAFHEGVWGRASSEHSALRTEASLELTALRSVLSEEAFEAAVEEVSRDLIRRRTPLVSAKAIWDRLSTT
jgi:hypothetical protein